MMGRFALLALAAWVALGIVVGLLVIGVTALYHHAVTP